MFTETEGIVLKQVKIAGGRRIVLLFSEKYGKISTGTGLSEKGKGKNALAMRPFTYGRYDLFKKGDFVNINGGETIESHYGIGEDIDKYLVASFALEFLDKITEEGLPSGGLFHLTKVFLSELEKRRGRYEVLLIAYMIKALCHLGYAPSMDDCIQCGKSVESFNDSVIYFSIPDGGIICSDHDIDKGNRLIYTVDFGIVNVLNFMISHSLESLQNLALNQDKAKFIRRMILEYAKYHMDFGDLKSESFIIE